MEEKWGKRDRSESESDEGSTSECAMKNIGIHEDKTRSSVKFKACCPKPLYPKDAVGIETAREEVTKLLNMTTEYHSTAVVIYGFGGIGKTTLANSVVAKLNLDDYNYAMVQLNEKMSKKYLKKQQELILKYAFPSSNSESIMLRDCEEGRDRLTEAFGCADKPVFLFIDNVLRSKDLKELLPQELSGLPKHSRILVTTKKLNATDSFLASAIKRCHFRMKTLDKDYATKILFKDSVMKDYNERILRICGGVPLALRIVHGHMSHNESNKSLQVAHAFLDALEEGGNVKEKRLSRRLLYPVYKELEDSTKDAFLDICCFFNGWIRRHVEYIVGALEVKLLEEAALVTSFVDEEDVEGIYAGEERLIVHSILSSRGRSMSGSTRLMDVESFCQAAKDKTGLKGIKGLWFEDSSLEYQLELQHLNSMRHSLRILCLGCNMNLEHPLNPNTTKTRKSIKFKELRYLKLNGLAQTSMHAQTSMQLEKFRYKPRELAQAEKQMKNKSSTLNKFPKQNPMKLKVLNYLEMKKDLPDKQARSSERFNETQSRTPPCVPIWGIMGFAHPQFEEFECDMLGIYDYTHELFPNGCNINKLTRRLRMIRASQASTLKLFSSSTKGINNHYLEELHLTGLNEQQLPEGLHQLHSLKIMRLDCYEMEEFPKEICQLSSLIKLSIVGWGSLKCLPESLEQLKGLTHLKISNCHELEAITMSFEELTALEHLSLVNCRKLKYLRQCCPKSLKYLNLTGCPYLILEKVFRPTNQYLKIVRE